MNGANFYSSWNRKILCYYLPVRLRHIPVYLCLLKELDKNKMSLHDLTFITFTLLLVANLCYGADKNETLSLTIDSQNVTSSEVSATLLEHINNTGKFFISFQIKYFITSWILTNFVFLLEIDAELISPIANVSILIGGNTTFDCMIPGSKRKLEVICLFWVAGIIRIVGIIWGRLLYEEIRFLFILRLHGPKLNHLNFYSSEVDNGLPIQEFL